MSQKLPKKTKRKRLGSRFLSWGPSRALAECGLTLAVFGITIFGHRWAYFWARRAAGIGWHMLSRLRGVALRNVDLCLPEKSETERTAIARASFKHFCYTFCDYLLAPRYFTKGRGEKFIEGSPADSAYMQWVAEKKAAFILAAHFGNWEVGTFNVNRHGLPKLIVIAKPIKPPGLNRRIQRARQIFGNEVHQYTGGARAFARALKEDRTVGILVDQNGGDFAPVETFFGVPCTWQADFTRLALRGGGRIGFAAMRRDGDRYFFEYQPSEVKQYAREADPMQIVRDYRDFLEKAIRENPEQYFWMHRRLKARKKGWADAYKDLKTRLTPETRAALLASRA